MSSKAEIKRSRWRYGPEVVVIFLHGITGRSTGVNTNREQERKINMRVSEDLGTKALDGPTHAIQNEPELALSMLF